MNTQNERIQLSYTDRAALAQNDAAIRLYKLMDDKKTNLCLADDEVTAKKFLELADVCGPEIAMLKTHIDIIEKFTPDVIDELVSLANRHSFLIFEDRKFADIGSTVEKQYAHGLYHIAEWADITNAHIVPGPGVIEGLMKIAIKRPEPRGLLLLAQMSSKGNLATDEYTKKALEFADGYANFVIGFIGNGGDITELAKLAALADVRLLICTPGVKLGGGGDDMRQQYTTPGDVIKAGSDIIIVGRGIYGSDNPKKTAQEYRAAGWDAYEERIKS